MGGCPSRGSYRLRYFFPFIFAVITGLAAVRAVHVLRREAQRTTGPTAYKATANREPQSRGTVLSWVLSLGLEAVTCTWSLVLYGGNSHRALVGLLCFGPSSAALVRVEADIEDTGGKSVATISWLGLPIASVACSVLLTTFLFAQPRPLQAALFVGSKLAEAVEKSYRGIRQWHGAAVHGVAWLLSFGLPDGLARILGAIAGSILSVDLGHGVFAAIY